MLKQMLLSGKYLADLAKQNQVICSMAYGDQPSLIRRAD